MPRKKATLIALYIGTLLAMIGVTMVGPMLGGSIFSLSITSAPNTFVDCKVVNFATTTDTSTGSFYIDDGSFEYGYALKCTGPGTLDVLFTGDCFATCNNGPLEIDFSFSQTGFSTPYSVELSAAGVSSGISGFLGLFGSGTSCGGYSTCVSFSDGTFSNKASTITSSSGNITGALVLTNLQGSLTMLDPGVITFTDSATPEPSSLAILAGGLGALAWLRRAIRKC